MDICIAILVFIIHGISSQNTLEEESETIKGFISKSEISGLHRNPILSAVRQCTVEMNNRLIILRYTIEDKVKVPIRKNPKQEEFAVVDVLEAYFFCATTFDGTTPKILRKMGRLRWFSKDGEGNAAQNMAIQEAELYWAWNPFAFLENWEVATTVEQCVQNLEAMLPAHYLKRFWKIDNERKMMGIYCSGGGEGEATLGKCFFAISSFPWKALQTAQNFCRAETLRAEKNDGGSLRKKIVNFGKPPKTDPKRQRPTFLEVHMVGEQHHFESEVENELAHALIQPQSNISRRWMSPTKFGQEYERFVNWSEDMKSIAALSTLYRGHGEMNFIEMNCINCDEQQVFSLYHYPKTTSNLYNAAESWPKELYIVVWYQAAAEVAQGVILKEIYSFEKIEDAKRLVANYYAPAISQTIASTTLRSARAHDLENKVIREAPFTPGTIYLQFIRKDYKSKEEPKAYHFTAVYRFKTNFFLVVFKQKLKDMPELKYIGTPVTDKQLQEELESTWVIYAYKNFGFANGVAKRENVPYAIIYKRLFADIKENSRYSEVAWQNVNVDDIDVWIDRNESGYVPEPLHSWRETPTTCWYAVLCMVDSGFMYAISVLKNNVYTETLSVTETPFKASSMTEAAAELQTYIRKLHDLAQSPSCLNVPVIQFGATENERTLAEKAAKFRYV